MKIVFFLDGVEVDKNTKLYTAISSLFFNAKKTATFEGKTYERTEILTNATEAKVVIKCL